MTLKATSINLKLKCGRNVVNGIVDSGAQISVIRADLAVDFQDGEEGKIKIVSAFGDTELAPLKIIPMRIDDGHHGEISVTCAVSEKLVSDMLLSSSAFDALNASIEIHGGINKQKNGFEADACQQFAIFNESPVARSDTNFDTRGKRDRFGEMQKEDESLKTVWEQGHKGVNNFEIKNGVLLHSENIGGENIQQSRLAN